MFNKIEQKVNIPPELPHYERSVLDKVIDNTFKTTFDRDGDECTIIGKIVKVDICAKETYNSYI